MTTGRLPSVEGGIQPTIVDAKGDIIVATAADTVSRIAVGANDTVLTADSSTATGLKWATPASGSTFVGCRLYKSSTQSVSNNTWTVVTYDSESFDTDSFHSTSSNTGRVTIPSGKAGKYLFTATTTFTNSNTGGRLSRWQLNGTTLIGQGNWTPAVQTHATALQAVNIFDLSVSDYVELLVYQDSGGALNINASDFVTTLSVQYLGA